MKTSGFFGLLALVFMGLPLYAFVALISSGWKPFAFVCYMTIWIFMMAYMRHEGGKKDV